MKRKCAFTLSEVLITLGIIGVVAAMTLPTIVTTTEKQETIAKLKKVYSVLAQGIKRSEVDNGLISEWPTGEAITDVNAYYEKYWKPYYKEPKLCRTSITCGYSSTTPWKNLNGDTITWGLELRESRVLFMLTDGTFIFVPRNTVDSGGALDYVNLFYIDLNGPRRPNVLGKDVFIFTLSDKNVIRPYGYQKAYKNLNCSWNSRSIYNDCTAKIMADGWTIKNGYPW